MLDHLWDGLKETTKKSRNPFFGAFIVTWSVKHWSLYYTILTFDSGTSLKDRKQFIFNYFEYHKFYWELLESALWALIILIASYIFLGVTRVLKKLYLNVLIPQINILFDKKIVKTRSEYDLLYSQYMTLKENFAIKDVEASGLQVQLDQKSYETNNIISDFGANSAGALYLKIINNLGITQPFLRLCKDAQQNAVSGNRRIFSNRDESSTFLKLGLVQELETQELSNTTAYILTGLGKAVYAESRPIKI